MSNLEQPATAVSSSSGINAAPTQRKKRHHSNVAAAIAARRAGHLGPGGAAAEDQDGQEMLFISSSRDASEEDNDDASGFSDSASSLRLQSSYHNRHSTNNLPTSARDRALVDSKEALRKPTSAAADKTPSSSSPPRHYSMMQGDSRGIEFPTRRPSNTGTKDPLVSATLMKASQALSASSSAELDHIMARGTASNLARTASMSSAGSGPGDGPAQEFSSTLKGGHFNKIDLASLPAPMSQSAAVASSQASIATPKAPEGQHQQREYGIGQPKRKTSNPMHSVPAVVTVKKNSEETDGEEVTDGAAASPYDGDVEFAARAPPGQSVSTSPHVTNAGQYAGQPLAAPTVLAPNDVPSNTYIPVAKAAAATVPGGFAGVGEDVGEMEEEVPMTSAANIRGFIHKAIYEPDPNRPYLINQPADGGKNPNRPIRIYADGVYDLFHYAHALQLRQAKLFFPSVYLIVGVVSSASCALHKNAPVLTSSERYTSVRNCKWVDEVVEDAPWVITQELLDKYQIDYVAHDEEPYGGSDGNADIYKFCKDQGRFLPTQRTKGVSTSELLARIVEQYRRHDYDKKLAKIGHEELAFH